MAHTGVCMSTINNPRSDICLALQVLTSRYTRFHRRPNSFQYKRSPSSTRYRTQAKRVSKEEAAAGEWAALLSSQEEEAQTAGVTVEDLNKISNTGLKLMLNEDSRGLMDFQDELNTIGNEFSEAGDNAGALFIYVLWKMCDHVIVDQTVSLQGIYLEAFKRVFDILEDSGWCLVRENEEVDDVSLDDIPNIPYMQQL